MSFHLISMVLVEIHHRLQEPDLPIEIHQRMRTYKICMIESWEGRQQKMKLAEMIIFLISKQDQMPLMTPHKWRSMEPCSTILQSTSRLEIGRY